MRMRKTKVKEIIEKRMNEKHKHTKTKNRKKRINVRL